MNEECFQYSYRDQRQNTDTPIFGEPGKWFWRVTRLVFTIILIVLIIGSSLGGSFLTHYMLEWLPLNDFHLENWLYETIPKFLVAIPLGFVIGIVSFDFRAGVALSILTMCSLYVPWGPYTQIAINNNGTGVFDFFLGTSPNQEDSVWRFREIAGISLWGLVLTFPSGYIMYARGFGSTYALFGGFAGLIYSISNYFNIGLGAYYLWGFLVWCALLIFSVNRLCQTIRFVVSKKKQPALLRCYLFLCYSKLYVALFEALTFLFAILLASCLFYIALTDAALEEKAMILFGLLGNTLALVITQSYRTGKCVHAWQTKRRRGGREGRVTVNPPAARQNARVNIHPTRPASTNNRPPPTYNQVLGAEPHIYPEIREDNERSNSPQLNNRILEDENNVEGFPNERTTLFREQEAPERKKMLHGCYMCIFFFQRFFYTDVLRLIQLLLDVLGGLALLTIIALTVFTSVKNWDSPRFL